MPVDERKAVIKQCDMEDKMAQEAVDAAVNALDKYDMPRDIAEYIKKQFDTKYDRTWFCIVGKHFGSYAKRVQYFRKGATADWRPSFKEYNEPVDVRTWNGVIEGARTMGEDRKAVVRGCTMNDTALEDAVATTADAFEKYDDSRDIATYVKKALDKKYGKAWQCIVGRDYGSFITHEPEYFVDFQYKGRTILLFKTIEP